ncbi:asparagine--tRNA ligase [Geomonas sp. RF6]|uniref:asparagine--tRNA ligase n=1 Tax=Geomonas sp. RF6 TaxID=2897342 RepID=UPI001E2C3BE6|nr:asparagine--tRNA ligase [Geomonas sp. RF6]UFS68669.1 asparagine--tRNA ligase [Geomonas sp. RF6]
MSKYHRIAALLKEGEVGTEVSVKGWVRSLRTGKGVAFIALNDGSCLTSLQIVLDATLPDFEEISRLGTGSAIGVEGTLVASPAKGQSVELQATKVTVYGTVDDKYPLQKKHHTFEFLRTIAHLRPRSNTFGAVFRVRSALSFAIHKFFRERGFIYVHTPIITANDCEGAGEQFRVTTLDIGAPPRNDFGVDFCQDFFGQPTQLTVSGQLEGEVLACGLTSIYTFGPTFRSENSNTSRHAAEFWMVEPEIAFADLADDADLAEDFIKYLCRFVLEECAEDMAFFDKQIDPGAIERVRALAEARFARMDYNEAIERLEKAGTSFQYPVRWGLDLQTEHERYLSEQVVGGPLFVLNYPKDIKAFYMRQNDDGRTVAAMDLLVPKVGEIIGGSQREERLDLLEKRMDEIGISKESLSWYLDSRRWGSCPHAGFGLGFERLIMHLTGMENIRDVIPFPRTPGHAEF